MSTEAHDKPGEGRSRQIGTHFVGGVWAFGGPDALEVIEVETQAPTEGEALVRVMAASVNPTDTLLRAGKQAASMVGLVPPFVPGMEFAGVVERLGGPSSRLAVGQSVMGVVDPRRPGGGAMSQRVSVPEASLAPLPADVDLVAASTIPMNALTAKLALAALSLPAGATVLITGGAGALGGFAVELASHAGLTVVADALPSDMNLIRALGASHIVSRGALMPVELRALYPDGVDGLVDAARIGPDAEGLVRDGGAAVWVRREALPNDGRLTRSVLSVPEHFTCTPALEWLAARFLDGTLTPRVCATLSLADLPEAHRRLEAGGLRGRIVIVPTDASTS